MNIHEVQADARGKIYLRTEDGIDSYMSVKDALAEVNEAMIGRVVRERSTRKMSSSQGHHVIEYRDGRRVGMVEIDAPAPAPEEEPKEWATTHSGFTAHRFDTETHRARCNRSWFACYYARDNGYGTRSYYAAAESYQLCPRCDTK